MKYSKKTIIVAIVLGLAILASCNADKEQLSGSSSISDSSQSVSGESSVNSKSSDEFSSEDNLTDDVSLSAESQTSTDAPSVTPSKSDSKSEASQPDPDRPAPTLPPKPADEGLAIPTGYGTGAWNPFGHAAVFSDKAMNKYPANLATALIKQEKGRNRIFVDNKEAAHSQYFGSFAMGGVQVMETIDKMRVNGANYIYIDVVIDVSNPNTRYPMIKSAIEDVLDEYPDAYVFVRYTPWSRNAAFHGVDVIKDSVTFVDGTRPGPASIASEGWIKDAVTKTREMIAYLSEDQEIASRIIGFIPLANTSGEWFSYDYWDGQIDISEANTIKFREWLKYRYDNDVSKLRKSWKDNSVTFSTAQIPRKVPGLSRKSDTGSLYQLDNRQCIDFVLYSGDIAVDRISQLARAVKLESGGKSLFAVFYGYHTELFSSASAHFNLGKLLKSKDIDIIGGPVSYEDRKEGGIGAYMSFAASIAASGKIWFDEGDYRTYLDIKGTPTSFEPLKTKEALLQVTRRQMGKNMVDGTGTWWADISGNGWFNDNFFWEEEARLRKIYLNYNKFAGAPKYDLAYVVDERGMAISGSPWTDLFDLLRENRKYTYTSGLNSGYFLLEDLLENKVDAKVLVMMGTYSLSSDDFKKLKKQVQKEGRTTVWMMGFGELTPSQVKNLTGFEYTMGSGNSGKINFLPNQASGFNLNTQVSVRKLSEFFSIKTGSAVSVLGQYSGGAPALTLTTHGKGKQLFYSTSTLNSELLRNIAEISGVNVYLDTNDTYYGNGSLSVIHAKTGGSKTLHLPSKMDVYSVFANKWYTDTDSVSFELAKEETEYFFIGKKSEIQASGIG